MVVNCVICLGSIDFISDQVSVLKCGHAYHYECVDQWLATFQANCPECRAAVRRGDFVEKVFFKTDEDERSYLKELEEKVDQLEIENSALKENQCEYVRIFQ